MIATWESGRRGTLRSGHHCGYWQTGGHHQGQPWHHGCVDNLGGVRRVVNLEGSHTRAEVIPVDGAVEVEGADKDGVVKGEEESREEAHSGMTWNGMGECGGGRMWWRSHGGTDMGHTVGSHSSMPQLQMLVLTG